MKRRHFLREGIIGGAATLGTGGFLFGRRHYVRADLASRMLDDALPGHASTSSKELQTLPVRAREEMRRYFHGKCLNVEGFVTYVCSRPFGERLSHCHTQDEREALFLQTFCTRVATDAEILNQVETIAAEVGSELDSDWADYCLSLSAKWNTRIQGYGAPLTEDELTNRFAGMIRRELAEAARQAASGLRQPSIGETIGKIGESAVRLLPLAKVDIAVGPRGIVIAGNPLVLPVFFLLAAKHLWDYLTARLVDRRGEYQAAISGRLAFLGNRAGAEFEREVRQRLTDLHIWQAGVVRQTAQRLTEERIGLL